jgi:hypothetical protein
VRRAVALTVSLSALIAGHAAAQAVRPRSADYLLVTEVTDVRALWVNPAGLGVIREASVLADVVLQAPETGRLRISQWGLGFNSRGISLGYQRDRLMDDPSTPEVDGHSTDALRIGAAFPIPHGAIGASFTMYRPNTTFQSSQRSAEVGMRYQPLHTVDLGAVLRNIGRPYVGPGIAPLTGTIGVGWLTVPNLLRLAAEASAAERTGPSGYDLTYRAGAHVAVPGLRVSAVTAVDFGHDLSVAGWTVGVSIGGTDQVFATASGSTDPARVDRFGLGGVSRRAFTQR